MFDPSTIAPGAGYRSHGMTYVSPSRLNLAVSQMPLFVMQYLMKMSSPVGAAAHRGQAVEGGVVMGLLDPSASIEACIKHAEGHFDRLCAFCGDPRKDKERQGIAGMVSIGIKELRQYGVPDRVQEKISRPIEGLGVDIMGFCDVAWSDNGCLIDLKTTHRIPSEISDAHARQLSHYIHGTNQDGRIAYLSSKHLGLPPGGSGEALRGADQRRASDRPVLKHQPRPGRAGQHRDPRYHIVLLFRRGGQS
jgi:hypothetical protein